MRLDRLDQPMGLDRLDQPVRLDQSIGLDGLDRRWGLDGLDQPIGLNRAQDDRSSERALVLAGGGAAGNAWELGLIAGLSDAGVELTDADLIIGTSAGSTVAAQITSGTRPADLYAAVLAEVPPPPAGDARRGGGPAAPNLSGPSYLEWSNEIIGSVADPPTCGAGWARRPSRWMPPTALA